MNLIEFIIFNHIKSFKSNSGLTLYDLG
uniref:Uncharacterized protein n=1 Tax=Arundo donax TaxID=35708 RepID=A0A0A8Y832_ARUDO